ncbi:hypothetical protein BV25DRAFT_1842199 [Artomyces pyxidatus]|uniref:Uncharacterized protein n=1 Tax=Artomyces pyxidatus TaxID=48021 RepID=A0ACB8SLE7_9AGAM|nr:hypothetical protein BV25DRAFT_1842199 [Artomyces pyxidatus]
MPSTRRFVHDTGNTPQHHRQLWEQGQQQAKLSIERYHYLCAAIQQAYTIGTVPGIYSTQFRKNWKCREGGILYCLSEAREWWNMVLNYHSSAATTGHKVWDRLFVQLKENNFEKGLIRCMFFARESGCLDPTCPFLHDEEQCKKDRQVVLRDRRNTLNQLSTREVSMRQTQQMKAYRARHPGPTSRSFEDFEREDDPELTAISEEPRKIAAICWNPACLKVKFKEPDEHKSEVTKISRCTRCRAAFYCSGECQNADWRRHKKDPCAPVEEIVENDDLWTKFGMRKGMGDVRIQFDENF